MATVAGTHKGYARIYRSAFNDPLWKESRSRSRWEAWTEIWAERAKGVGSSQLERGEFQASYRDLMHDWQWSLDQVRQFIKYLIDDERIEVVRRIGKDSTVYRVVNYEKFNGVSSKTPAKTQNPTVSPTVDPIVKQRKQKELFTSAPTVDPTVSPTVSNKEEKKGNEGERNRASYQQHSNPEKGTAAADENQQTAAMPEAAREPAAMQETEPAAMQDYVDTVLTLYERLPSAPGRITPEDRRAAEELRSQGHPLDHVEATMLMLARRNHAGQRRVNRLAYFLGPVRDFKPPPGKLRDFLEFHRQRLHEESGVLV